VSTRARDSVRVRDREREGVKVMMTWDCEMKGDVTAFIF
jgi:G:T-mismatch repair DNA endonuclease (very short patch repair protein)